MGLDLGWFLCVWFMGFFASFAALRDIVVGSDFCNSSQATAVFFLPLRLCVSAGDGS